MNNDYIEVRAKLGNLYVKPTQADHIYCQIHNENGPNIRPWIIRGVEYTGSLHMHLYKDGKWRVGPEFKRDRGQIVPVQEWERRNYAFLKRSDWLQRKHGEDGPSSTTRDLIIEAVTLTVNAWASVNPSLLHDVEVEHVKGQLELQRAKIKEATAAMEVLVDEYDELESKLERLQGRRA